MCWGGGHSEKKGGCEGGEEGHMRLDTLLELFCVGVKQQKKQQCAMSLVLPHTHLLMELATRRLNMKRKRKGYKMTPSSLDA